VIILAFVLLLSLSSAIGFAISLISGHLFWWCHGVYPPLVMENYGPINQGVNYGIVFCGYSVAAFFAPKFLSYCQK
jgi:OFA family oxalate/formate antiporter-like MFS transporter